MPMTDKFSSRSGQCRPVPLQIGSMLPSCSGVASRKRRRVGPACRAALSSSHTSPARQAGPTGQQKGRNDLPASPLWHSEPSFDDADDGQILIEVRPVQAGAVADQLDVAELLGRGVSPFIRRSNSLVRAFNSAITGSSCSKSTRSTNPDAPWSDGPYFLTLNAVGGLQYVGRISRSVHFLRNRFPIRPASPGRIGKFVLRRIFFAGATGPDAQACVERKSCTPICSIWSFCSSIESTWSSSSLRICTSRSRVALSPTSTARLIASL